MTHFKMICPACEGALSQCRCASPNKKITLGPICTSCQTKGIIPNSLKKQAMKKPILVCRMCAHFELMNLESGNKLRIEALTEEGQRCQCSCEASYRIEFR